MNIEKTLNNSKELEITKIVNCVLDAGLKVALPNFLEDDVIDIKNAFIKQGFAQGIQELLNKIEDITKSITGIFNGNFETVEQVKRLIQKDGILEGVSKLLDEIAKSLYDNKVLSKDTYNLIKSGKKLMLNTLEDNLESMYQETSYSLEKLDQYCEEWKENYKKENYKGMESSITKIETRLQSSEMVEKIIEKARTIQKIQKYIEEKGSIENLSESEKNLLEKMN